jgi:hypothetical protein
MYMLYERLIIVGDSRAATAREERRASMSCEYLRASSVSKVTTVRVGQGKEITKKHVIEYGYEAQLGCALAWGRVEKEGTIESVCVRGKPRIWRDLTPL